MYLWVILQKWSEQHEGQFVAPMSWINEKVVPIYTLASVTYCKDLPGKPAFRKLLRA